MIERAFIFGLGTGRCGTVTFKDLLNLQGDCWMTHELPPRLSWQVDERRLNVVLQNLLSLPARTVGDVAMYYLPYVELIMHKLSAFPVRFVVLRRNREETVGSLMRKTETAQYPDPRNHWQEHDGKTYNHDVWDECFPKFVAPDKRTAVGMYWDSYYAEAERLIARYPGQMMMMDLGDFSEAAAVERMLRFCGFDEPVVRTDIRSNASRAG